MIELKLTKSAANNLMEFIEFHFIQSIRDDEEIDNMAYLVDMCDVYKQLVTELQEEMTGGIE